MTSPRPVASELRGIGGCKPSGRYNEAGPDPRRVKRAFAVHLTSERL